jgi:diketogulonate reductase-like aldo/keto reductase
MTTPLADRADHTASLPPGLDELAFRVGYGTHEVGLARIGDEAYTRILERVLETGYRHLDTAQVYDTEPHVAAAIDRSNLTHDEVFVATKLHWSNLGYDDAIETAKESRETLRVDSIDLLYVHVPVQTYDPDETLPALDTLVDDGVVDRVGLSNFTPEMLEVALDRLETPVFAHQVEMHPLLQQETLHAHAVEDGHWLVAFSPVIRGLVREIAELRTVAADHDATTFDVSLAWLLSKPNVALLTHTTDEGHMRANREAAALELDEADLATIDAIDREWRAYDGRIDPWNQP